MLALGIVITWIIALPLVALFYSRLVRFNLQPEQQLRISDAPHPKPKDLYEI